MINLNKLRPVSTFWRKAVLIRVAQCIGEENNSKVPGGSLRMTEEFIQRAQDAITITIHEDGTVQDGGIIYPSIEHTGWTNYGPPVLTQEEIEWMEAIMYNYGLPWGG